MGGRQRTVGYSGGARSLLSGDPKAIDAAIAHTSGDEKWSWSLDRQQAPGPGLTRWAAVLGQQASKNPAPSGKFSLDGATVVRACASGEASGDEG